MFGAEMMTGTTQLSLQRCNHTSVGTWIDPTMSEVLQWAGSPCARLRAPHDAGLRAAAEGRAATGDGEGSH